MPKSSNSKNERALAMVQRFVSAGFDVASVTIDGRKITVQFADYNSMSSRTVEKELQELEAQIGV
ncbi:MAG: hypothetical protein AAF683_01645 [Pseudomonadota bacterium]